MRKQKAETHSILVQRKLSEIILKESNDPRFERVTITRVQTAKKLTSAQVFFSIYPPEHITELTISLNKAAGFFSKCLGHALMTRNTPRLVFIYDKGFDYSNQIDTILKQASEEDHLKESS